MYLANEEAGQQQNRKTDEERKEVQSNDNGEIERDGNSIYVINLWVELNKSKLVLYSNEQQSKKIAYEQASPNDKHRKPKKNTAYLPVARTQGFQ